MIRIINEESVNCEDRCQLIKKAIKGDKRSINELIVNGYKVRKLINPLSTAEFGSYEVTDRSGKVYNYDNTLSYYSSINNSTERNSTYKGTESYLVEMPISGSGNLTSYVTDLKNLIAQVRGDIKRKARAQEVYSRIIANIREDIKYGGAHWARTGQSLSRFLKLYDQLVLEFKTAYPSHTMMGTKLDAELATLKHLISSTPSTRVK